MSDKLESGAKLIYSCARKNWEWRVVSLSLMATLFIFLFLPFTEFFLNRAKKFNIRKVDIVRLPPPPPQKILKTKEVRKKKVLKPRLARVKKKLTSLRVEAALPIGPVPDAEDVSFDFEFAPEFAGDEFVFELEEVDTAPEAIVSMPPIYPLKAKARGIEGAVQLMFTVTSSGMVETVQVKSSTPGEIFVESAVNAVKKWRFEPATKGGRAVAVWVSLPLKFMLKKSR